MTTKILVLIITFLSSLVFYNAWYLLVVLIYNKIYAIEPIFHPLYFYNISIEISFCQNKGETRVNLLRNGNMKENFMARYCHNCIFKFWKLGRAYYVSFQKIFLKIEYGFEDSISNDDLGLFQSNNQLSFSFVLFRFC